MPNVHTTSRMIVDWGSQDSLVAAMMDPAFYPKPPDEVTHKETHISHLFFAGDLVYKLKKPIRYSPSPNTSQQAARYSAKEKKACNGRLDTRKIRELVAKTRGMIVAGLLACSIAKQRCITMGTKGIEIVGMDGQMLKK